MARKQGTKARSDVARKLGATVARLRQEIDMSQDVLACDSKVSSKVISQLERGVSVPSIERLARIANVLLVPLPNLFDFDEYENDRRYGAWLRISYLLRGRTAADLGSVLEILRRVFEIKRRERPSRRQ